MSRKMGNEQNIAIATTSPQFVPRRGIDRLTPIKPIFRRDYAFRRYAGCRADSDLTYVGILVGKPTRTVAPFLGAQLIHPRKMGLAFRILWMVTRDGSGAVSKIAQRHQHQLRCSYCG